MTAIVPYIEPPKGDQSVAVYYHYTNGRMDYYEVEGRRYNVVDPSPRTISEKDMELLQRYDSDKELCIGDMDEREDGEYVRWDALIQLLK